MATVPKMKPAPAMIVAAAGSLVFASAAIIAAGDVTPWEVATTRTAARAPDPLSPMLWAVMQAGTRGALVAVPAVVLIVGRRRAAAVTAGAGAMAWALSAVVKAALRRARPTSATVGADLRDRLESPGFPSSHAAIAAALAVALVLTLRPRPAVTAALLAGAAVVGSARVYFGVHWPLDVVAGAAIGAFAAGVVTLGAEVADSS